jgi:hypothetical protein
LIVKAKAKAKNFGLNARAKTKDYHHWHIACKQFAKHCGLHAAIHYCMPSVTGNLEVFKNLISLSCIVCLLVIFKNDVQKRMSRSEDTLRLGLLQ